MVDQRSVVVGVDGSLGSDIALRWAVEEARSKKLPLRLVCAYTWNINLPSLAPHERGPGAAAIRRTADDALQAALELIDGSSGDLDIATAAVEGPAKDVLIDEAENAAVVVLGSRQLQASGSFILGSVGASGAAHGSCPVVVTRGPAGWPPEQSKLVVGVDAGEDSQAVLEFAFDMAARHGTPLHAVLCWHPSLFSLQRWTGHNVEDARTEAEIWLSTSMAGWQEKYPDVAASGVVLDAHPVGGLVEASLSEYLVVVGKKGRGARAGTVLGSVSQGVLHHATCPVAVVPVGGVDDAH
jgi:nucleotide-binding universal stress UspA family protein